MSSQNDARPLILGGAGRLGRALAQVWPVEVPPPLYQSRNGASGTLPWDILNEPAPDLPPLSCIVVLAGVTQGSSAALALNTPLAQAGADLGMRLGVPVLIASSQAVYGPQQGLMREDSALKPWTDYGRAKAAMEAAVTGSHVTHLRISNVAGCDALAAAALRGGVKLDRFADGHGPRRAYVTPGDLAHVLIALAAANDRPRVVNIARAGTVAMADVLAAAGVSYDWIPAPWDAVPELALDVTLLQEIYPLPPVDAQVIAAALL